MSTISTEHFDFDAQDIGVAILLMNDAALCVTPEVRAAVDAAGARFVAHLGELLGPSISALQASRKAPR